MTPSPTVSLPRDVAERAAQHAAFFVAFGSVEEAKDEAARDCNTINDALSQPAPVAVPGPQWQPIESAPKDGNPPIFIAQFNPETGELISLDADGIYEMESESWEMPRQYRIWKSWLGLVEEPTHWMPMPPNPPLPPAL